MKLKSLLLIVFLLLPLVSAQATWGLKELLPQEIAKREESPLPRIAVCGDGECAGFYYNEDCWTCPEDCPRCFYADGSTRTSYPVVKYSGESCELLLVLGISLGACLGLLFGLGVNRYW